MRKKRGPQGAINALPVTMENDSMKIMLTALIFTFFLTLSSVVICTAGEVDGFRGMKWGTPIAEFRKTEDLVMRQNNGRDNYIFYSIANDDLRFEGINAVSIRYFFWRDKFAGVVIVTEGERAIHALKAVADERFGLGITGIGPSGEEINDWSGEMTVATLSSDMTTRKGQLVLFSRMISELREGLEAERSGTEVERGY